MFSVEQLVANRLWLDFVVARALALRGCTCGSNSNGVVDNGCQSNHATDISPMAADPVWRDSIFKVLLPFQLRSRALTLPGKSAQRQFRLLSDLLPPELVKIILEPKPIDGFAAVSDVIDFGVLYANYGFRLTWFDTCELAKWYVVGATVPDYSADVPSLITEIITGLDYINRAPRLFSLEQGGMSYE